MGFFETFSKRQKRLAKAGQQDVYQYTDLPETFRTQVVHIWNTTLGRYHQPPSRYDNASPSNLLWQEIHDNLARELGLIVLSGDRSDSPTSRCIKFLYQADVSGALDIIELSFVVIDRFVRKFDAYDRQVAGVTQNADSAIEELNHRFREHGIGFQYLEGMLVRLD